LAEDTDGTAFVVRPIEEDEVVESAATGSFAAVTRDDVRVVYNAPVIGEDESVEYEERIAPIASFSNDGTTITVSFANADVEEFFMYFYTIAVDREEKKTEDYWAKFDPIAQYAPSVLGYVDKDVAKVAQYGSTIYSLVKGIATVDVASLFSSATDLLKLAGVITTSAGVTNEQPRPSIGRTLQVFGASTASSARNRQHARWAVLMKRRGRSR